MMAESAEAPMSVPGSAEAAKEKRQAIVWISGLSETIVDQTALAISHRVAVELDRNASTPSARFALKTDTRQEAFGGTLTTEVCTILRFDGDQEHAALDVYRLPTESVLTSDYIKRGALVKALLALLTVLRYIPKTAPVFAKTAPVIARRKRRKGAKTPRERRQLLYARLALLLLFVYVLVLLFALATAVIPGASDLLRRVSQISLLGFTVAGIWKADVVRQLANAAIENFCVMHYLDYGYRSDVLRGHLGDLVEHLAAHEDINYTTIDVIAYSFGTIVAIDTFFPAPSEPPQRLRQVRALVTIGCPFDLIRTYWPHYFEDRYISAQTPGRWFNVYSPIDVLASNFRNDDAVKEATESIGARTLPQQAQAPLPTNRPYIIGGRDEQLSAWEALVLVGLRAHSMYWGREFENETSVFGIVVPALYADDDVMR